MTFKVIDFLALPDVRDGDAVVLAGHENLARAIRWVGISERLDIAPFLKGGELLVMTGMELARHPRKQRRYVRDLAGVNAAGLMIRLGEDFPEMPRGMIAEAKAQGLPLIVLRRRIGAIHLTEQVHSLIIGEQFQLIERAEMIARDFTRLVTGGGDLPLILERLAATVENPVVLEDPAHQIVEYAAHAASVEDILDTWELHSREGHGRSSDGEVQLAPSSPECLWADIVVRGDLVGRLHVLAMLHPFSEIDHLTVDRAATAVALTLLGRSEARHLADHACNALIADVLGGRLQEPAEFYRRCSTCRVDLEGKDLAVIVVIPHGLASRAARQGLEEYERQAVRTAILSDVREAVRDSGCRGLCGLDGDRVIAIVGVEPRRGLGQTLDEIGTKAVSRIARRYDDLRPRAGVSGQTSPHSLLKALRNAYEAADLHAASDEGPLVTHFDSLGPSHLLLRLAEGPELARYVESELGPLLEHDARARSPLLPTLRAFIDCGGRKSEAARRLSIERRSVYHRLARLELTMGRDLSDEETRHRLWLALSALDLLRRRRPDDAIEYLDAPRKGGSQ